MKPGFLQRPWVRTVRVLPASVLLVLCAACTHGEILVVEPAATDRSPLTVFIQPDPEDSGVARALGWSTGIPGAEVTITAGGGDTAVGPPVATLQTDSAGRVSVPDLPDGKYFVQVRRLLTGAETARLAPGEDVIGFMTQVVVDRGSATVSVPASRRRSIVISEWSFFLEKIPGVGGYEFGGYLELANNSDTTVYLDGLVIGRGVAWPNEPLFATCGDLEYLTNDPGGVWTEWFDSLPGTGHTFPLAPGAVAVVATDAIDHSTISPEGVDLSHADFEFIGTADADNPSVPNTTSLGEPWYEGHGLILNGRIETVVFVALPVDTAALPTQSRPPFQAHLLRRVPRDRILDVMAIFWPGDTAYSALCPHLVSGVFERRQAPLDIAYVPGEGDAGRWSVQRKVTFIRSDGRKILQHTRTTDADFFLALRTPFRLP